ncbi:STAS domain-containing protein [Nonomuraea roseoviolacea]|uniref:Anti-sigma factor antagonist n=1 Tax=Nonomuraea roseoviolacea subsp. carminata TaxID=160689 RepID=A0ABT1K167_9ACTN|nr:STAS domain-containing protein [Nonomuraea roseoviolacea]MCP2347746.1 anti-anti-sigma factor [Nonomuraea roseoviolacea subsp. carminata]
MPRLTFACQHLPGATVITVGGEIDSANAARVESFIAESRRRPGDHLVFDLTEVRFMDSAGLRTLLNAYLDAEAHGGSVRLAALQPMPARLVAITRVDEHLPVHATVQEALTAALSSPEPRAARPATRAPASPDGPGPGDTSTGVA